MISLMKLLQSDLSIDTFNQNLCYKHNNLPSSFILQFQQYQDIFAMLNDNKASDSLLWGRRQPDTSASLPAATSAPSERINVNNERIDNIQPSKARQSIKTEKTSKSNKKSKRKDDTQFTTVLKFVNILIGLGVVAFGAACYYFFDDKTKQLSFLGAILPGYIAFSGLIILLIECNIGFMIRNMRFLYNFIGRGLFNIYVGIMPLSMITKNGEDQKYDIFQIIIFVMVSLMCLVGVLYIVAKIFCCAKEDPNKKRKRRGESDSDSEE